MIINKGPEGPLGLTMVSWSSPDIPHLLEERHDFINYGGERAVGILTCLNHVATLVPMLEEHGKSTSRILVDLFRAVARATSSRSGPGDIRRHFTDVSVPAIKWGIRCRE